jgi:DNA polymerase III delta prime subunit
MIIGHKKQLEFLKKKLELNQLSHAYLFSGPKEIGKKTLALEFAELLDCRFPDLLIVESVNSTSSIKNKKDNLEIDIGQIRDVQKFLSYKSYHGGYKMVVVDNAERMNIDAQDCFLKDLEEPKGKTLIILVSSKPDVLLPTIFSRCQAIKFFRPKDLPVNAERAKREQEIYKNLLPVIGLGIAEKFKYVKDFFGKEGDFSNDDISEIVEVLQKYFRNLLLSEVGIEKNDEHAFGVSNKKYTVEQIKNILNLIDNISNKLIFTNANPKLALEILLMEI